MLFRLFFLFILLAFPAMAEEAAAPATTEDAVTAAPSAPVTPPAAAPAPGPVPVVEDTGKKAEETIAALDKAIKERADEKIRLSVGTLIEMAKLGNADAAFRLGQYYHLESAVPNNSKAQTYYEQAAAAGNLRAVTNIGQLYRRRGLMKDALGYFERAAQRGDKQAYKILAEIYLIGSEMPRDEAKGLEWLEKGFAAGSAASYSFAADAYFYGFYGLPKNLDKAVGYYDKAAELGEYKPKLEVAQMFIDGRGVEINTQLGLRMLSELEALKVRDAVEVLGQVYAEGRYNVPSDKAMAVKYWVTAAGLGSCMSMKNLGIAYDNGWTGQAEPGLAADYIEQAAQCGTPPDPADQWKAATRFQFGKGRPVMCAKAVSYYDAAAKAGYMQAINDVAALLERGCDPKLFPPNPREALRYYLQAARMGAVPAQFKVAQLLDASADERERYKAYGWYMIAKDGGNAEAQTAADKLYASLSPEVRNLVSAHISEVRALMRQGDVTSGKY